jgi:alpha-mannosidase
MHAERSSAPSLLRPTVFLPCHTLDDFPYWLDEREADDLLAAWTAAWHPAVIAGAGEMPVWASADLSPPTDMPLVGIVPAFCDERFAAQFDAASPTDSRWVRGIADRDAVVAAAAAAVEAGPGADGRLPGSDWADDFRSLGLGVLLSELLARRMRSSTDLDSGGFAAAVVAAARSAVEGRGDDARAGLEECFGWLEGWRARYYPVDFWLLDLVLLADSTLGRPLAAELEAGVPLGIVTSSELIEALARDHATTLAQVRERVAAGTVSICGGSTTGSPRRCETGSPRGSPPAANTWGPRRPRSPATPAARRRSCRSCCTASGSTQPSGTSSTARRCPTRARAGFAGRAPAAAPSRPWPARRSMPVRPGRSSNFRSGSAMRSTTIMSR